MTGNLKKKGDIDIDFKDRSDILKLIEHIPASRILNEKLVQHNSSIYIQKIPIDPDTGISAIDYEIAEKLGYYKIDFLNVSAYHKIRSEEHLNKLINQEPNWELLEVEEVVGTLFQIHDSFDIVKKMKPQNIDQLAMVLALIRPNKRRLVGKPWNEIEKTIWNRIDDSDFRRSHALSYAIVVVVQLNLLVEELSGD
jgi:hypothetical protein